MLKETTGSTTDTKKDTRVVLNFVIKNLKIHLCLKRSRNQTVFRKG